LFDSLFILPQTTHKKRRTESEVGRSSFKEYLNCEKMIRKFKSKDLEEILRIEKKAFPKTPYDEPIFVYYTQIYPDNFLVYVEESSDKIFGYIIFRPGGHIVSIAVDPMYRRKGIGTKLMDDVLKVSNGNAKVEVRESNKIAQMFYKKLGFFQSGSIIGFYDNEDAIVMIYSSDSD